MDPDFATFLSQLLEHGGHAGAVLICYFGWKATTQLQRIAMSLEEISKHYGRGKAR